jgi:hypothetical protein
MSDNATPFGPWPSQVTFAQMVDSILNSAEYDQFFGNKDSSSSTFDGTFLKSYEAVPHRRGASGVVACVDACHTNGCGTTNITNASTRCDGATSHSDCHCDSYVITSIPKAHCVSGPQM